MDNTPQYMGGKVELSIGSLTIGPEFLSEVHVTLTEGTRSTESLSGTVTQPSGMFTEAQVTGSFILPSMDALKTLFQGAYEEPDGEGLSGRVRFGGNTCTALQPLPVNIHQVCEQNSDNDVHIFAGLVSASFDVTYNQGDMITVPFTILAQPTAQGYAQAGAGDLTQKTIYDPTTNEWKPLAQTTTAKSKSTE